VEVIQEAGEVVLARCAFEQPILYRLASNSVQNPGLDSEILFEN
jgi:hypothetical protein